MRNDIALIAAIISVLSALPYIIDTARGKTHPNLVTWLTWTLLNTINTVAAIHTGAIQTAIFTAGATLATGSIFILGLKRGVKKYTPFDIVCQTAALPTWRHAWIAPFAETWQGFAIGGFAGLLTITASCAVTSGIILLRRRTHPELAGVTG